MANIDYIGTDLTTKGSWIGVYGGHAYGFVNTSSVTQTSTPSGTSIACANSRYVWESVTTNTRGIQTPDGSSRLYSTFYDSGSMAVDVRFGAGVRKRIAIYQLDYEGAGRMQRIDAYHWPAADGSPSGTILATTTLSTTDTVSGVWSIFEVTEGARFVVTQLGTQNAVVAFVGVDDVYWEKWTAF